MFRVLGIPTWVYDLLCCRSVLGTNDRSCPNSHKMNANQRENQSLEKNAVTGAQMFEHRVECFFWDYILDKDNPSGKLTYHIIKMEFQKRGSIYTHCLLWVDEAPHINVEWDKDILYMDVSHSVWFHVSKLFSQNRTIILLKDKFLPDFCHGFFWSEENVDFIWSEENVGFLLVWGKCWFINIFLTPEETLTEIWQKLVF